VPDGAREKLVEPPALCGDRVHVCPATQQPSEDRAQLQTAADLELAVAPPRPPRQASMPCARDLEDGSTVTPDDGPPRRAGAQVAWLDRPHQTPAVKDRNPVRDRLDIGQDVRREQHRDPALALLEDQLAHVAPAEGIEPAHRLIE